MIKRKLLILDEKTLKDLKKVWKKGIYEFSSDSFFVRELIEKTLEKENKK